MIFAVTERGTVKRCERMAIYSSKNAMHLTPLVSPLNLSLGSLMHRGFQLWLDNPTSSFETQMLNASVELQKAVTERYKKVVGTSPSSDEMLTTYEAVDLAISMAANYETKWGSPLPDKYRLIKPEQKVIIPIPGTEHPCERCAEAGDGPTGKILVAAHDVGEGVRAMTIIDCPDCGGSKVAPHFLQGRLDGLIQHIPTGRLDVLEHKTYGQRPKEEALVMNAQFISYIWLVEQLGYNAPEYPAMIAYDGLWRRKETPRGRVFDDLFLRVTVPRMKTELEEFQRFLVREAMHMAWLYANPDKATTTVPWNGCWDCKFTQVCRAQSRGDMARVNALIASNYTQRTDDVEEDETNDDN